MNANEVLQAIRHDHIRDDYNPGGMFYAELEAPSDLRRIDALWVQKFSGRVIGYEIKVSRQDLQHELRQPEKCDPWKRFCDEWWLAVSDPTLIIGLEDQIPDDWGICTPPTAKNRRKMTVLRPCTKLAPVDKTPLLGKLAGSAGADIERLRMERENSRIADQRHYEQINDMRAQLRQAGVTEEGVKEAKLIQAAIPIAEKMLRGDCQIIETYRFEHNPERFQEEATKLGALLADAVLAREIDRDLLREAQHRMERVQSALTSALGPLKENWSLKRHTEALHRIISTREESQVAS